MLRLSSSEGTRVMRSGVIARKVGMTRVFDENGHHVPVTVMKLDNVQWLQFATLKKTLHCVAAWGWLCQGKKCLKTDAWPLCKGQCVAKVKARRIPCCR